MRLYKSFPSSVFYLFIFLGSLLAEAEALSVAFEIFQELSWMRHKHYTLRLGHTYLLDSVLIHFAIDEALHSEVKAILMDIKVKEFFRLEPG